MDSLAQYSLLDWKSFFLEYLLKMCNISRNLNVPCAVSQLTHLLPEGEVTIPPSPPPWLVLLVLSALLFMAHFAQQKACDKKKHVAA